MCGYTAEDEGCEERQRDDEGVEEAIVSFSHTVADPGAVMIEALCQTHTTAAPDLSQQELKKAAGLRTSENFRDHANRFINLSL